MIMLSKMDWLQLLIILTNQLLLNNHQNVQRKKLMGLVKEKLMDIIKFQITVIQFLNFSKSNPLQLELMAEIYSFIVREFLHLLPDQYQTMLYC